MNKTILIGRLTKAPELRYGTGAEAMAFCSFTVAVNRIKKGEADFIGCKCFGKTAEFVAKYFDKGSEIALEGRINTGSYENKEGKKVYTTDVMVERVEFVGSKKESNGDAYEPKQKNDGGYVSDDEDLPF